MNYSLLLGFIGLEEQMLRNGGCAPKSYGELVIERDIALSQRDELLDSLENLRAWVGSLAVTGYAGNVPPAAWHKLTIFCDKADAVIARVKGKRP